MRKKGVFFTIITLVILSLFVLTYTIALRVSDSDGAQKRVATMSSFLEATHEDLERQLYTSLFRMLFIVEKRIAETGSYIPSVSAASQELFFNGSLAGSQQELMNGVTLTDITTTLTERAAKLNIALTLSDAQLEVSQDDPWTVKITLSTHLVLNDTGNAAHWAQDKAIVAYVPVTSFEDPLYALNTQGKFINKIAQTPVTSFVQGTNVANLSLHVSESYYTASTQAPSFLNRLEGSTAASPHGIESLVNLPELSKQGITVTDKSVVDYIYFSGSNPQSYRITGMPSWFRLDQAHLATYGAEALAY